MPNPSKSVACCELAAQIPIPISRSRGPLQKWHLIRHGPTRRPPRTCLNAQGGLRPAPNNVHVLGTTSRFLREARCFVNGHSQRQFMHTPSSTKPKFDSDQEEFPVPQAMKRWKRHTSMKTPTKRKTGHASYTHYDRFKDKLKVLQHFKKKTANGISSYASASAIPKRVKAATDRALQSLQKQGRTISRESFKTDVRIRLSSMFPYQGIPTWWVISFQELFQKATDRNLEAWQMPVLVDYFTRALINTIEHNGIKGFKIKWKELDPNVKAAQWPLLAFWLLRNSPTKIPDFLLATNSEPFPPFGMISDCMLYLSYFHPNIDADITRNVVLTCMDPERWPIIVLPQRGVRLYVKSAGLENVNKAFEILRSRESQISAPTMLGFMNIFIQARDVEKALECLRVIPVLNTRGFEMNSEGVVRHCCKLLQLDRVVEEGGVRNFEILPQILELGVKPSTHMMNIVLTNAFATGNTHLGLDMLKYMKDHGMEFTSYTYMALLDDAVAQADRGRVDALLQEINSHDEIRNNKYIACKAFHAHFVFGAKRVDKGSFGHGYNQAGVFLEMLNVYSRYYDLTPLRDLGIIPKHYDNVEIEREIEPGPPVLFIMLATYLRCNPNCNRTLSLYRRFWELVHERHPLVAPLVQFPHIFNEFIHSFRYGDPDLKDCVAIIDDMLNASSEPFMMDGDLIEPAKPTVWTWNTLMSVFIVQEIPNAVQTVRDTMEKNGIEFDLVTWNTILTGTTTDQSVESLAKVMKEMDAEGFLPDSYTLKALGRIQDPEPYHMAMQKMDQDSEKLLLKEQEALEREDDELLDKGLKRLAISSKK